MLEQNKREKQKEKEQQHRMALATELKKEILTNNQIHKTDTGSPEVQIALLSGRLTQLNQHFKLHKMDHASRKGLLTMVARRRRLLTYLRKNDPERYKAVLLKLGIRH